MSQSAQITRIPFVGTIDVEPLAREGSSGPPDWTYSEKSVRALWDVAQKFGFPLTFFLHPEAIEAQAPLYKELERQGAVLGLHLHPQKWSANKLERKKYFIDFGGLSAEAMRELLTEHIGIFERAFGYKPLYFSPGTPFLPSHCTALIFFRYLLL